MHLIYSSTVHCMHTRELLQLRSHLVHVVVCIL